MPVIVVLSMVIALANPKGGVGKSTLALLLAIWLQAKVGSTVLVEADGQQSSSDDNEKLKDPVEIWVETRRKSLRQLIREARKKYDYVVVDGPGGQHDKTVTLLGEADLAVFPVEASPKSINGFKRDAGKILVKVRHLRKDGRPYAIAIANQAKSKRSVLLRELRDFCAKIALPICKTPVIDRDSYRVYPLEGAPPWELGGKLHRDSGPEIQAVIKEVIRYGKDKLRRHGRGVARRNVRQAV